MLDDDTTLSRFFDTFTGQYIPDRSSFCRKHFETYWDIMDDNWANISDSFVFTKVLKYLKKQNIKLTKKEVDVLCDHFYDEFYTDLIGGSFMFPFKDGITNLPYNDFVKLGERERKKTDDFGFKIITKHN